MFRPARQHPDAPPKARGARAFICRWRRVARLALMEFRLRTNEPGEPLWPRPLTARGTFMLWTGLTCVLIGVSYLVPSAAAVTTVEPIRAVLPPPVYASLWIVAGALVVVLGPTKWWYRGLAAVALMHGGWAAAALISWLWGDSDRGFVLALLYLHGAVSCSTVTLMLNRPRKGLSSAGGGPDA